MDIVGGWIVHSSSSLCFCFMLARCTSTQSIAQGYEVHLGSAHRQRWCFSLWGGSRSWWHLCAVLPRRAWLVVCRKCLNARMLFLNFRSVNSTAGGIFCVLITFFRVFIPPWTSFHVLEVLILFQFDQVTFNSSSH